MTKDDKHFFRSTFLIAICAFLSRVLGLLRVSLLASFYGATESDGLADCYAAAFKLPDIVFNIVAFGAISIVLIPYFSGFIKKKELTKLKYYCSTFLNFFLFFVSIFLVIGFFFAPFFVKNILVRGWVNETNIMLTTKMTRILLLQVLFMTLSGIFGSFLNAIERFTAYAIALLSYNIGIILGIIFLAPYIGIEGVAWGAVGGSFLHFMIQMSGSFKNGFKYSFGLPKLSKEIKELIFVAIPRIIAISFEQFVKFFIVNIASFLFVGSIFIFENAENFSMVPFGMIAVSISTTVFPIFSKLYVAKQYPDLLRTLFEKIRILLFLMMPVAVMMVIFRTEIIELLLAYKRYTANDVLLTANALAFYMMGIPFFSITIVVVKFYYAQKRSVIPMIVTLISAFITVVSSFYLSKVFEVSGLSIGRSIGYFVQMVLLILFLIIINRKERLFSGIPWAQLKDITKIIFFAILLLIAGLVLEKSISFVEHVKFDALLKIFVIGGGLTSIYLLICYVFKVPEIRSFFKKK